MKITTAVMMSTSKPETARTLSGAIYQNLCKFWRRCRAKLKEAAQRNARSIHSLAVRVSQAPRTGAEMS